MPFQLLLGWFTFVFSSLRNWCYNRLAMLPAPMWHADVTRCSVQQRRRWDDWACAEFTGSRVRKGSFLYHTVYGSKMCSAKMRKMRVAACDRFTWRRVRACSSYMYA